MDHLIYFNKLGVLKWWNDKQIEIADWYADSLWFIGVLCYLFMNIIDIFAIKSTIQALKNAKDELVNKIRSKMHPLN